MLVFAAMIPAVASMAQITVTGMISDSLSGNPIPDVTIRVPGRDSGTISSHDGTFRLVTDPAAGRITFSAVGYIGRTVPLHAGDIPEIDLGNLLLAPATIGLQEVWIIAAPAKERETPVAASTIDAGEIAMKLGDQPLPEVMKTVPGVYASRQGGGSGDASVNIRGFKQENVALLLNGVPIGSVENGLVYWNNWQGLGEATQEIQVQRGLGVSNIALNSVGGTINIITKTTEVEKGGSLSYSLTDYGNSRINLTLSTGRMKNDMAVTFMGSRIAGPGYADATYVDGWAYFLSVTKEFNDRHMLVFTALGNPERHGQRNFKLSKDETDRYGLKYNKDWGSYNGQVNNASENFYHKPHLSLNHYWDLGDKGFLATSAYFSAGKGGGKWTDTFGSNPWIFSYYNASGQLDWESIYQRNYRNEDIYTLANGQDTSGYSVNIQTNFLASHIWTGIISTYRYDVNERFRLVAGVHGRHFKSRLQQKVRDLLGGEFYIDDFAYAMDGVAGREQIRHVGDIVKVNNGAGVEFISGYAQAEYRSGRINAFIGGTVSQTWYRREDRYNYISNIRSEWVSRPGADIKGGVNFNMSESSNLYANAGYFSMAPYFKFVFGNYNNIPTGDLKNEKVATIEAGYGFLRKGFSLKINAYMTKWEDKSVLTNEYNQFENPVMLQGLDAFHQGVELDVSHRMTDWLRLGGIFSLGDWKWKNDVSALLYDDFNAVVDTIHVYADGLYVGDAPQLQAGLTGALKVLRMFDLNAQWVYYDRFYSDFNPAARTDFQDREQSYRIPSYHLLDLFAGYGFGVAGMEAYIQASCYNVLNSEHIIRGEDGAGHSSEDFRGFWGFGRTFNFSFKISF